MACLAVDEEAEYLLMTRKGEAERIDLLMPMESKINLIKAAEKRLSTELTAHDMQRVLAIMTEVLDAFDVRETEFPEE